MRGSGTRLATGQFGSQVLAGLETADQLEQLLDLARRDAWLAAVVSSTMAAFCWVTWSIWLTRGVDLLQADRLLLGTRRRSRRRRVLISVTSAMMRPSALPVSPTRSTPCSTCLVEAEIKPLISLAASAERWASARTSEATTAKPLARLARARSFDAGVQGQEVGLEGDLVDHADDLADLLRRPLDVAHGGDGLAHDFAALLGVGLGGGDDFARMPGAVRRSSSRWR